MIRCKEGDAQWVVTLVAVDDTRVELAKTLEDAVAIATRFEQAAAESLLGSGDVLISRARWRNLQGPETSVGGS